MQETGNSKGLGATRPRRAAQQRDEADERAGREWSPLAAYLGVGRTIGVTEPLGMTTDDAGAHKLVPVPEGDGVECPRCGEIVDAYASRCRGCGVNYLGPAWQVGRRGYAPRSTRSRFLVWLIALAVLTLLIP